MRAFRARAKPGAERVLALISTLAAHVTSGETAPIDAGARGTVEGRPDAGEGERPGGARTGAGAAGGTGRAGAGAGMGALEAPASSIDYAFCAI